MTTPDELLEIEHRFWDASSAAWGDFYRRHCTEDALFVFGPVGVLDRDACAAAVDESDVPWAEVRLSESRVVSLGDRAALVTYRAVARHEGVDRPVELLVSSAYVHDGTAWKLAFHQQTPTVRP